MLRKLMKHELRATGRVMVPMLLITLICAVGGNLSVYHLVESGSVVLNFLGIMLLTAFFAALAGTFIVSFVLMIRRFYQNLLRDEGYLMMTLPVTVNTHVLGKLLVSVFWAAVTAITALLAMFILMFELEYVDLIFYDLGEMLALLQFDDLYLMDYAGHAALFVIEVMLLLVAADACLCLQLYAAMAAGHSFTHHKGLFSVAAYFVFAAGWSILQNGAQRVFYLAAPDGIRLGLQNISAFAATHINMLAMLLLTVIPAALWYAVTIWFLKHRLNLD